MYSMNSQWFRPTSLPTFLPYPYEQIYPWPWSKENIFDTNGAREYNPCPGPNVYCLSWEYTNHPLPYGTNRALRGRWMDYQTILLLASSIRSYRHWRVWRLLFGIWSELFTLRLGWKVWGWAFLDQDLDLIPLDSFPKSSRWVDYYWRSSCILIMWKGMRTKAWCIRK